MTDAYEYRHCFSSELFWQVGQIISRSGTVTEVYSLHIALNFPVTFYNKVPLGVLVNASVNFNYNEQYICYSIYQS